MQASISQQVSREQQAIPNLLENWGSSHESNLVETKMTA